MRFHCHLAKRQTQAGAAPFTAKKLCLCEFIKNMLLILKRYTNAIVSHTDLDAITLAACRQRDGPPQRRVFNSVGEQVGQYAADEVTITRAYPRNIRRGPPAPLFQPQRAPNQCFQRSTRINPLLRASSLACQPPFC
jgi:hypothetical protein